MSLRQPVIFCDFDGTITNRDVIVMIMERFAPPLWHDIMAQIIDARTLSIRDGVKQLFDLIPTRLRPEIEQFVADNVTLRDGFSHFIDWCHHHKIPYLVVSGGMDFFIEPVLADYREKLSIYCNAGRFNEPTITFDTPHAPQNCLSCNECAVCKIEVMENYPTERFYRITIGDSLTDLAMARVADKVFARAKLKTFCDAENIAYTPFESFDDIRTHLEAQLHVAV